MHKLFYLLSLLVLPMWMNAQDEQLRYEDFTYLDNIKSVRLYRVDSVLSQPIVPLKSAVRLRFSFDDMDADNKDYIYTLTHCDANWQPSDIDELDYLDGFTENNITDYQFSYNTIAEFTHYSVTLPNEDVRWTKSGNYLLKVYEDEDDLTLAITRRFVVAERIMNPEANFIRPANPEISSTHQQLDLILNYANLRVNNPQDEISITVLQNGRWDNALTGIKPTYNRNEKLVYDRQAKIIFPGGKEFRHLDLSTFNFKNTSIEEIEEYENYYKVYLRPDKSRTFRPYVYRFDLNGKYFPANFELSNQLKRADQFDAGQIYFFSRDRITEHAQQSDYAWVYFTLEAAMPYEGKEIYIYGGLTDWQLHPNFRMEYNEANNTYEGAAYLKQGFYDYAYAMVDQAAEVQKPTFKELEGHWHETENDYTILVYWKPFGQRFESVSAFQTYNTVR